MNPRPALGTSRTVVTPSSGEIVHLPGDRAAITGTIGEVGQALARLQNTGRLVSATAPTPTGVPSQVLVNVRLIPRPQVRHEMPRRRQLSRRTVGLLVGGAVVALAGFGWLLYAAITAILEHAAVILGALLLVAVALVLLGKASGGGRTFSGTFRGSMD